MWELATWVWFRIPKKHTQRASEVSEENSCKIFSLKVWNKPPLAHVPFEAIWGHLRLFWPNGKGCGGHMLWCIHVVVDTCCGGYRRVVLPYPAQHSNVVRGNCHSWAETCIRISWNQMLRFRLVPKCLEHPAGPGPKLIHSGTVWVVSHIGCESSVTWWGHMSHESGVMSHESRVTGQSWATVGPCKWWEYDYNFLLHQILLEFISIWF